MHYVDEHLQYMKNYPFAEARVKRETERNPQFRTFLNDRNNNELTARRDIVSLITYRKRFLILPVRLLVPTADTASPDDPHAGRAAGEYTI